MEMRFFNNVKIWINNRYAVKIIFFISIIISLSCLIYIPSLKNGTTNWDDQEFFLNSSAVKEANLSSIFTESNGGNYYPITILSMALDHKLCQSSSFCFHMNSFLLHTSNSILIFMLIIMLLDSSFFFILKNKSENNVLSIAFLTSLIFTLHPMNVEAIAWISALNHPLGALFQILSLITYIQYLKINKSKWYFLTYLFFILAIFSKSGAIILPLLFLGLDYLSCKNLLTTKLDFKKKWQKKIIEKFFFIPPVLFVFWLTTLSRKIIDGPTPEIFLMSLYERLRWASQGIVFYISHIIVPRNLSAYYDIRQVSIDYFDWILSLLFIYFIYLKRKNPLVTVGFIFFIINILPALKIIPFGEYSIFNDRYTYFSSVGLFMTFFAGILFNDKKIKWIKILVGGILVSATISYSFLAKQRVAVWTNSEKMWLDVLNVYPKTSMALNNLGRVYLERNELELARIQFLKALEDRPDLALAYYNLGLVAKGQNDIKAALEYYHHAIALKPNYPEAFNNLGSLQSNLTEAVFSFRQAILIGADFPEVYYNLSLTYYRLKQYKEALLVLNIMHKKWPHENRGQRLEQEIQKNIP